jgi:hypothetical protein
MLEEIKIKLAELRNECDNDELTMGEIVERLDDIVVELGGESVY